MDKLRNIPIIEDTINYLDPQEKIENFILWDSMMLDTVAKGDESRAIAIQFTSMGTYFEEHWKSNMMKRPNEKGQMIIGGANIMNPTISFDAYYMTPYRRAGTDFETFCNNMNKCKEQLRMALREKTVLSIKRHFPITEAIDGYIIDEFHILIGQNTRTILGFRVNMIKFLTYTPNYNQVSPEQVNDPTYSNGAKL